MNTNRYLYISQSITLNNRRELEDFLFYYIANIRHFFSFFSGTEIPSPPSSSSKHPSGVRSASAVAESLRTTSSTMPMSTACSVAMKNWI